MVRPRTRTSSDCWQTKPLLIAENGQRRSDVIEVKSSCHHFLRIRQAVFLVSTQVGKPGKYELRSDTTLAQALATAGRFTDAAKHSRSWSSAAFRAEPLRPGCSMSSTC